VAHPEGRGAIDVEILDRGPREVRRLAKLGRIQGASKLIEDDPRAPWVFDPDDFKVLPSERPQGWSRDPSADV
jgi:hypothetical protein